VAIEEYTKDELHLRPAIKITQTAEKFNAEIQFLMGNEVFNAKSITDILIFASALVVHGGSIKILHFAKRQKFRPLLDDCFLFDPVPSCFVGPKRSFLTTSLFVMK